MAGLFFTTRSPTISAKKITRINWLPFYYHYYSTEAVALKSLLSIFLIYFPVGLGIWLWHAQRKIFAFKAGLYAIALCLIMESSKLFLANKHPDPTNLLISFGAAYITYSLANLINHWLQQPEPNNAISQPAPLERNARPKTIHDRKWIVSTNDIQQSSLLEKISACVIFLILFWKIIDYPLNSFALTSSLLLYGLILRFYSQFWLIAIPALLPAFNLAPWSGRFFFTELDYFILLTLALGLWYGRWKSPARLIKASGLILLIIYTLFYCFSLLKGLLPLQDINANAFSNYYSHYNSLRIAKGYFWALLLIPLLAHHFIREKNTDTWFIIGILSGLTLTILFAILERYTFVSLFDFDTDYRITSTFFSMHTGGAHLDAYILLTLPFIFYLPTNSKHKLQSSLLAIFLFSGALYTLMVTFSRGSYIAFVISMLTLMFGFVYSYKQELKYNGRKLLWIPILIFIITAITLPVLQGDFIQHRFKQSFQEANIRSSHWKNAYEMMDNDWLTTLIGMGLGSFPRTYFWKNFDANSPATYQIETEHQTNYLKLGSGAPLYIEQTLTGYATEYTIKLDFRIYSRKSQLDVQICEKAVQHSFNCQGTVVVAKKPTTDWQHFEQILKFKPTNDKDAKISGLYVPRPRHFILRNSQKDAPIEIKNISLLSNQQNLIKNGNFSKRLDNWYFTADDHIPWRTENQWIQILFEQGWIGLILFCLLVMNFLKNSIQQLNTNNKLTAFIFPSLTGFCIITIIDSPFDMPRITLLFFLMTSFSVLKQKLYQ